MKLNCKTWFAAAGLAGLLGTGAIILGADTKAELGPIRAARLDGNCPALETPDAAKCEGGMIQGKGFCICLTKTKEGDLSSEVAAVDIDQSKKAKMLVCDRLKDGAQVREVLYLSSAAANPLGCYTVVDNVRLPNVSMNHVSTGIEDQLFEACYPDAWSKGEPNIISPGSWGLCPYCMLPTTPACKYPEVSE